MELEYYLLRLTCTLLIPSQQLILQVSEELKSCISRDKPLKAKGRHNLM